MTKDKILKVAAHEFATYGYDAVSMNNLVKKLDVNKATIYYHYKDKRSLYNEVIKEVFDFREDDVKKLFDGDLDGKSLLKAYIRLEIESIHNRPYLVPLVLREVANLGANLDQNIVALIENDIKHLELIFDKLDLKDGYKDISPYAFYSMIMGTILNFYSIQMSDLSIGSKDNLKKDSKKSLNYITDFVYNIIISTTKDQ